jgi:hypothetical protein
LQQWPEKTDNSASRFARNKDSRSSNGFTDFAFLAADCRDENEFSFLNPQIAEIHPDFLRRVLFSVSAKLCANLWKIRQAATVLAVSYRFADRVFAFNASVSRFRGGALVTSDSRR